MYQFYAASKLSASVQYRIIFKICTVIYRAFSCMQPSYLHWLFTPVKLHVQLRSSISDFLVVPNIATKACSVAASTL